MMHIHGDIFDILGQLRQRRPILYFEEMSVSLMLVNICALPAALFDDDDFYIYKLATSP